MKTLRMYPSSINDRYLDEVAECLRSGGIIIYPTDTLYAMGCDALNNGAIERLCRIKGVNPQKQTLSVVCDGISMASEYARIDNEAFRILRRNLPGPFTFVLPAASSLPKVFKGRKEVGIRVPDNPIATAIAARSINTIEGIPISCMVLASAAFIFLPDKRVLIFPVILSLLLLQKPLPVHLYWK